MVVLTCVFLSDLSRGIFSSCTTQLVNAAWIVCVAAVPTSQGNSTNATTYVNIPFVLWDAGSLVAVPFTRVVYSFPTVPQLLGITGCDAGRVDDDWTDLVLTVNCPTVGNTTLAINTANVNLPITVAINGVALTSSSALVGTILLVELPPGTGQGLPISVRSRAFSSRNYSM